MGRTMGRTMALSILLALCSCPCLISGYHRTPCKESDVRRQFQFSDCYAPNMNPSLPLKSAGFVMAHDSATGYMSAQTPSWFKKNGDYYSLNGGNEYDSSGSSSNSYSDSSYHTTSNINQNTPRWTTITRALLSLYGKTQVGTAYDQLNDGARALDLRPKIYTNGTVGFHHGSLIDVPLHRATLGDVLQHAKKWCADNPGELVLIFHSELSHEAGYNGLSSQVYLQTDEDDDYLDNTGDNYYANNQNDDANNNNNNAQMDDAFYNADDENNNNDDQNNQNDDANNADDDTTDNNSYRYYYSGIAALKAVYQYHGVPYHPCEKIAGLTVEQAMELADLSKLTDQNNNKAGRGYLLALDRHDIYASFCGKANWVEGKLVTCYDYESNYKNANNNNNKNGNNDNENNRQRQRRNNNNNNNINNKYNNNNLVQCTDRKNTGQLALDALQSYAAASSNADATDSQYELGPPADSSYYPFNEIQALWQVDATSVQAGLAHASTLLEDNRKSQVNRKMVKMAYEGGFNAVNVMALDNVALNGNAMFSVLRNACGQSVMSADLYADATDDADDDDDGDSSSSDENDDNANAYDNIYADIDDDPNLCGPELEMPIMDASNALPIFWNIVMIVVYGGAFAWLVVTLVQAFGSSTASKNRAKEDEYHAHNDDIDEGVMT